MENSDAMGPAAALLAAAGSPVQHIHDGVAARGFTDPRPTHGFVFARLAPAGATVTEIADLLGFTRQAASQIVDELERKGYVERRPHPYDARTRLVLLTDRGVRRTEAADAAAAEAVLPWRQSLGEERLSALREELARLAPGSSIRPVW